MVYYISNVTYRFKVVKYLAPNQNLSNIHPQMVQNHQIQQQMANMSLYGPPAHGYPPGYPSSHASQMYNSQYYPHPPIPPQYPPYGYDHPRSGHRDHDARRSVQRGQIAESSWHGQAAEVPLRRKSREVQSSTAQIVPSRDSGSKTQNKGNALPDVALQAIKKTKSRPKRESSASRIPRYR